MVAYSPEFLAAVDRAMKPEVKRVEAELARHIGPIAAVVVRNAAKKATAIPALVDTVAKEIEAAKARDEAELYLLISDEIKDAAERKSFIRKAVAVSRRR